ncbi:hypothetical protein [Acinetobacter boissieri]|uniref:Uncharacterized protein n=1 Tax=Acinetobacter boissieri TaxID=1219383 RepID=A0A1G6JXX2_9GAMM|nr:hypothetical protein [Acinetobacter boissieri]SDC23255.1 hypothetical protein SAMN05421733_1138 [Acinetobacter boissieri]
MFGQKKKPGYLAPIVITGITAGVLYKAYKAIFVDNSSSSYVADDSPKPLPKTVSHQPQDVDDLANDKDTDEPLTSK